MKEAARDLSGLPDEIKLHIFSFFGTREACRFAQVNSKAEKLSGSYRLRSEYEIFRANISAYENRKLILAADNYDKYCKILALDPNVLKMENIFLDIIQFADLLAKNGLTFSLNLLYSKNHIDVFFRQFYEQGSFDKSGYNSYDQWIRESIEDLKVNAAYYGSDETIKYFFPNIVTSKMLATIISSVEISFNLGNHLIMHPPETIAKKLPNPGLSGCSPHLIANLRGFRECIQYLLQKGVVTDLSDDNYQGAVSWLSESDTYISIYKFCSLYRDFVLDVIKDWFDLVLDAKSLNSMPFSRHPAGEL